MKLSSKIEYQKLTGVKGSLVFLKPIEGIQYGEIIKVKVGKEEKIGKVLELSDEVVVAQLFVDASGIDMKDARVIFTGELFTYPVSEKLVGRILDGLGNPLDKGPELLKGSLLDVNGKPINPIAREEPTDFIETGISAIDGMMSLVRGQKLPIFSGSGLPHNKIAAHILNQLNTKGKFAIVFAGLGITEDELRFFQDQLKLGRNLDKTVMILNSANDPAAERLLTPRIALTIAEFLAFEKGYQVVAIITDMTAYANSLREISSLRNEIPGRKGYPGYLYSDLTQIYERCGIVRGKEGSLTILPILSMPNDDITHPIPDLSGYITEGQMLLSRELNVRNLYPPFDIIPSLSRLMKDGVGEGKTRDDHVFVVI